MLDDTLFDPLDRTEDGDFTESNFRRILDADRTFRLWQGSGGARRPTLRPHSTGTEVDLDEDEDEDEDAARHDDALIDEEGRRVRRRRAAQPHADGGVSEL